MLALLLKREFIFTDCTTVVAVEEDEEVGPVDKPGSFALDHHLPFTPYWEIEYSLVLAELPSKLTSLVYVVGIRHRLFRQNRN